MVNMWQDGDTIWLLQIDNEAKAAEPVMFAGSIVLFEGGLEGALFRSAESLDAAIRTALAQRVPYDALTVTRLTVSNPTIFKLTPPAEPELVQVDPPERGVAPRPVSG